MCTSSIHIGLRRIYLSKWWVWHYGGLDDRNFLTRKDQKFYGWFKFREIREIENNREEKREGRKGEDIKAPSLQREIIFIHPNRIFFGRNSFSIGFMKKLVMLRGDIQSKRVNQELGF